MCKFRDLSNQTFSFLTVIKPVGYIGRHVSYLCQCRCGRDKVTTGHCLRMGHARSCANKECKYFQQNRNTVWGKVLSNTDKKYLNNFFRTQNHTFTSRQEMAAIVGDRPLGLYLVPRNPARPIGPKNVMWGKKAWGLGKAKYLKYKDRCLSISGWAEVCGVSRQRIHQLLKEKTIGQIVKSYVGE
jgi:hypothetical protein